VVEDVWETNFDEAFAVVDTRSLEAKMEPGVDKRVTMEQMRNLLWGGFLKGGDAPWRYTPVPALGEPRADRGPDRAGMRRAPRRSRRS
jgi:hypothetical protein